MVNREKAQPIFNRAMQVLAKGVSLIFDIGGQKHTSD
ncbi:MAG: hypothetical protein CM1200mP10_03670 [Candidatus Neomarinimicrobiota bacterium]|nr:MAG: hypothetical protein CM1200mP10_03670 [Candidatus Neomarinimicrobiota bacterium]